MKRVVILGVTVLALACDAGTGPDLDLNGALITAPTVVTLAYGEEVQVAGTVLRMILSAVPEDSRCPTDVTCVWEGNAVVEVGITAGTGPTVPLQMNTTLDPQSARWNDLQVTLVELRPVPTSATSIRMEDYVATVRVEPVG